MGQGLGLDFIGKVI